MAPLRIVFMGTPGLAGVSLQALLGAPAFQVAGIVTQPDQPGGRGLKLQPSPVKEIALRENLPLLQPKSARDENFFGELAGLQPEAIAVVAYGQILPGRILDLPRLGCLNVHTSLLPKYRGAAPIQWAILNDESETGVSIMKLDAGLDTGDILAQEKTPIHSDDNSQTLHERLGRLGAALLLKTLSDFAEGKITPRPQPKEGVSHAPKIKKTDGLIDWNQPARAIWNRVRAMVPWPGAFTHLSGPPGSGLLAAHYLPRPQRLKILAAELTELTGPPGAVLAADKSGIVVGCGAGALRITALQREGGRRLNAQEFLAGCPLVPAQRME